MARRTFKVRDIDEILSYWHTTGSIQKTAQSLGVNRKTVRKYVSTAKERGYTPGGPAPEQGWRAFVREVMPWAAGYTQPSAAMELTPFSGHLDTWGSYLRGRSSHAED